MTYVRIKAGKVVYKSPHNDESGLIEVPDSVCCGMIQAEDGTFSVPPKESDPLQYQDDRRRDFPSIGDQLDYIFHNGLEKWKTDIVQPVKDKYPKP